MALTVLKIKQAKHTGKRYRLYDRDGLYLEVTKTGRKYWRIKYRFGGKEKVLGIGRFPELSLKDARRLTYQTKEQIREGIDPHTERKKRQLMGGDAGETSFRAVADEWYAYRIADKSESYQVRTERLLRRDLLPFIGQYALDDISAPLLLGCLRQIEDRGAVDMAKRACQTASQVFTYGIQTGKGNHNPARDLSGALKTRRKKHYAAIIEPEVLGRCLRDMEQSNASLVVKTALLLTPILFQRPGELRKMEWAEIEWSQSRWCIPADKMKMRYDHVVPLPTQALTLLQQLYPYTGKRQYVFPSPRGASRPISENGVRMALRDLGWSNDQVTPHGFRATARTLLDEVLGYRVDWIEQQLAHQVKDANGRAYNRTRFFKERAAMMQAWADYLDTLKAQ